MELSKELTDEAICREIGERLSRRRLEFGLTQAEVARQADIPADTRRLVGNGLRQIF